MGWKLKPVPEPQKVEVIKTETKVVIPDPVEKTIEKVVRVPVEKIIYVERESVQDSTESSPQNQEGQITVKDSVDVKWEQKHYSGSDFDLYISGILPQVDSLSIYSKTKVVTETKYKDRWEFGPYINGEFSNNFGLVSAGAELSVPYRGWEFSANGGYGLILGPKINHGWIVGAKVKYNILYR